ncbi:hypothetical protein ACIQOF_37275 [Streptomyces sp. NPDC091265]|uniref:hypothetical protein n=1 Tax=unclassified Streptomyces TaxID=2593676 RepID=UPI00344CC386
MSTMRRLLGTGPLTPKAHQAGTEQQLRLLAAERTAPSARLTVGGEESFGQRGRRRLGTGTPDA